MNKITFEDLPSTQTPINAENLNRIQKNIADEIVINKYILTTEEEIPENIDYEIPCYYKVGADVLDIFYMGEKLIKGEHFIEVGETGTISNIIQFYNWEQSVPAERTLEFVVRGVYTNES